MSRDTWSNANNFLHSRRDFLSAGASLAVLPWVAQIAAGIPLTRFAWSKNPFQLGVASGDPTSDGVVLWTRLAPEPLTGDGLPDSSIEVTWEISSDESMQQIIRTGKTLASPALNHSVHVEVDGLSPDRWY
ncbi:MAG: PhoD-like phosphatase N-terminal domain-containing protein, partial [Pirellula sp.]